MYAVVLESEAQRFFEEASASLQQRLDRCFDQLKLNPSYHPNIKILKGDLAAISANPINQEPLAIC